MNKKFSTLLAGALLMSAFSASAQQTITGAATGKYEAGKSYLLGNGSVYLTVGTVPGSSTYGQLSVGTVADELEDVNAALWTVSITPAANGGAPKFTFVNKATGLPLSVDYKQGAAWQEDGTLGTAPVSAVTLGGAASEWYNGVSSTEISAGSPLMSGYRLATPCFNAFTSASTPMAEGGKPGTPISILMNSTPEAASAWAAMAFTSRMVACEKSSILNSLIIRSIKACSMGVFLICILFGFILLYKSTYKSVMPNTCSEKKIFWRFLIAE